MNRYVQYNKPLGTLGRIATPAYTVSKPSRPKRSRVSIHQANSRCVPCMNGSYGGVEEGAAYVLISQCESH